MSVMQDLRDRRSAVVASLDAISKPAAAEGRAFTTAEQSSWDAAMVDLEQVDERLEQVAASEKRAATAQGAYGQLFGDSATRPAAPTQADRDLDAAFRSAIFDRNPRPIDVHWHEPRSVFQPGVERRDLTKATANLYPVSFYSRLVEHMVESSSVLRAGATLLTTSSGEDLRIPKTTALSTSAIVAEGGLIGESDPGLGVVTLGAFKYGCYIEVSTELVQDTGFDLVSYLAKETGQSIGLALGAHLVTGTGTGQPRGAVTDATTGVTGPVGTSTSFGAQGTLDMGTDTMINLAGSLAEPYIRSPAAGWLMRTSALTLLRKLKTTTAGELVGTDFIGAPPAGSGAQGMMLNAPLYVDPALAAPGVSAKSVIFGDWSKYFVRMVNGVRFERSDDFKFQNDLVAFRALLRADAALVDTTGALKVFVHSAT